MEWVGTIQFKENGRRGNPVALFLDRAGEECRIGARLPRWKHIVGTGATVNKAAGDFELKLHAACPSEIYDGPSWKSGIKAEKPAPPKPVAAAPPSTPTETPVAEGGDRPSA